MEPWLIRIADYLLAQSWQIAVLTIAVALATFGLRNRSAHVRYLLWLIVLAKALVPPLYSIPVAVLPQQERAASVPAPPTAERIVAEHRAPEAAGTQAPRPAAGQSQAASSPQVTKEPARYDTRAWLAVVWLAGVIALSFYYLANALRTQIWLQRRRKTLPGESARAVESFFAAHGLKRMPRVWLLERINQPFVWGLMRGSIYLPARLLDNRHAKFQASLLGHELCHVIRLDATINLLQVIAQTVFWFHPCLWWANAKIRAEREKCCDEMTIARLNARPEEYSEAIVETLAAKYEQARPVPSLAVAGQVKNIEERIKTMLRPGKKFYKRPSLIAASTVLFAALLTVPTALVLTARAQTKPSKAETNLPQTLHQAAAAGDKEPVQKLLAQGVDVHAKDKDGRTPLHSAAWYGRKDVAAVLLAQGANINEADGSGQTPLHLAANFDGKLLPGSMPGTTRAIRLCTRRLITRRSAKTCSSY
jgi:beta-lactamase regulating signal transducer with metallopeptidase domain